MVYLEFIVVGGISLIVGLSVGFVLVKYTNIIDRISKKQRYKQKVINDPELLLEKLKENGAITDMGKKVDLSIVEVDGKKEIKIKIEEEADQQIQTEVDKKVKKITKKTIKKKKVRKLRKSSKSKKKKNI